MSAPLSQLLREHREIVGRLAELERAKVELHRQLLPLSPHKVGDTIEYEKGGKKLRLYITSSRVGVSAADDAAIWIYSGKLCRADGSIGVRRDYHSIQIKDPL